jgi:Serine acetyltransferase
MGTIEMLISRRKHRLIRETLMLLGVDFPAQVRVGKALTVHHRAMGTVLHPATVIGDRVTIYHQVTIGRADAHVAWDDSPMESVEIGDDAILYAGAKVLGGPGITRVGKGTIVAANAVLTQSTGDWEVWGGVPAKLIGKRQGRPEATRPKTRNLAEPDSSSRLPAESSPLSGDRA